MSMRVSDLAGRAGVSPDAIRYYGRAGLLRERGRTASGYRIYDESSVARLRFIKGAQRIGLRLAQIRELLEIRDRGACPCGHTHKMLGQRISDIDAEITELTRIKRELSGLRHRLPDKPDGLAGTGRWPCERAFMEAAGVARRKGGG